MSRIDHTLTARFAIEQVRSMIDALRMECHIFISKAYLFGSVAKGTSHRYSDIDVALWSNDFLGCTPIDLERFAKVKSRFPLIEVHTFALGDTATDNPFIEEIEKGVLIED